MRIGSLFSGVGGLELGLEWAGVGETIWQVERDPACRQWLAEQWPGARRYEDVVKFCRRVYDCEYDEETGEAWCDRCDAEFGDCACVGTDQVLDEAGWVDVLCGGFPCQDISQIGKRRGLDGEQSGLWKQFARIVRELGPRFVVVENVARLTRTGLDRVLADLADLGYDAEWSVVSACAVGAPHTRERVFIVAYAVSAGLEGHAWHGEGAPGRSEPDRPVGAGRLSSPRDREGWWTAEPGVGPVAHGVPDRMALIQALGNAVVPQVAEVVGRRLLEIDRELRGGR